MRTLILVVLTAACSPADRPVAPAVDGPTAVQRQLPAELPPAQATPVQAPPVELPKAASPAAVSQDLIEATGVIVDLQGAKQGSIAIDIDSKGWPGRGMDPVLIINDHPFTAYEHTSPTGLRFTGPDPGTLESATEGLVQYGDAPFARVSLTWRGQR